MSDGDDLANSDDAFDFADEQDLIAAILSLDIRNQRKQIRQQLTDPYNRLQSIALDASFVKTVSRSFPEYAVVSNLRCGSWYVDPQDRMTVNEPVYFKSTDGHIGEWAFSMRRPNLGLLKVVEAYGGVIIVDSTRRGKRFPDALSKTIPIWCSVINRALVLRGQAQDWSASALALHTPKVSVSGSEASQIEQRLQGFAQRLASSTYTLPDLSKPLRPIHICPSTLSEAVKRKSDFESCLPVVCLSASRHTSGGSAERMDGYNYVPGSGDDHEAWAPEGFGPGIFWRYKDALLATSRGELTSFMREMLRQEADATTGDESSASVIWIGETKVGLCLRSTAEKSAPRDNLHIHFQARENIGPGNAGDGQVCSAIHMYTVPSGTKDHYTFFSKNAEVIVSACLAALRDGQRMVVHVDPAIGKNGEDLAVATALSTLTLAYTDEKTLASSDLPISKAGIARRLQWIIASSSGRLNPSRGILKRVNSFLFDR